MTPQRVLIVEPDHPFGLSLASLFQNEGCATRVARGAAEAELEIATRRPDLIVLRAELPDLSGFSLCARLRHDRSTAGLPVILYSSDTAPASLAEHARTPWAANGYLAMPLDTAVLLSVARRLLAAAAVVESADDAVIEEAEPIDAPLAATPPPIRPGAGEGAPPPPAPKRPVRDALTEEDRILVGRIFQSIAERRDSLLAEASQRRPPPRRELLQSADGRLQLMRDDVKAREAQIAQLSELWEIREREVSYAGEWLHEKDVELQGLRGEIEDLRSRLAEAHAAAAARERAHGEAVDGLILERVRQEKDLIEAVAAAERRVHDLERELRGRVEELARRAAELRDADEALTLVRRSAEEAIAEGEREHEGARAAWERARAELEAALATERASGAAVEASLAAEREGAAATRGELAAERAQATTLQGELAAERERSATLEAELAHLRAAIDAGEVGGVVDELRSGIDDRDKLIVAAQRENDRLQAALTTARHELMLSMSEGQAIAEREAARVAELTRLLVEARRRAEDRSPAAAEPPGPTEPASAPPQASPSPEAPPNPESPASTEPPGAEDSTAPGGPGPERP